MITMEAVALAVFLFTYGLIMSERIHRTVAAMFGAAVVMMLKVVPWEKLPEYLDLDTIFLLAGMMIIVNTARNSGLFEYLAIKTAKLAKGSPIRVLLLFSVVTALVSSFLDNVTTVLLLTPMLLYISRLMEINPMPFLLSEIFASNIGGAATLIGDPPNIMIGSAAKLSFMDFILNMSPIAFIDLLVSIVLIYFIYRGALKVDERDREKINRTLERLDEKAAIKDLALFRKSIATIGLVVVLFFLHDRLGVEPAVVALFGASFILLWSREKPEEVLEKVEWATLFFFGGLFIIVGGLVETGFIGQLANWITSHIVGEGEALIAIAWFSAFASAIIDNIPFTATMIPLIKAMGGSLNVYPLWWALSLGACLGGNGTAIGASANVVVIGIAEREGVKITFGDFLKVGMFIMMATVAIGVGLLWIRYVWW
ncbi:MAG: ArsB/NhaD family transporter [Palaeococcus sp.]|uniref:SLC13 family permease n=1 Tax=Palaeococcus sp. (in: euryarchaeotes) TaxID=2820298 RepID=UPI000F0FF7C6|nr:ArsB/NhaD family transporter [Palaeococcus sp. (in: euryarchaeotes)]MCD6559126.1 ArsB/NhaD family transporter [Palaeococcus sp. (in: euryarchaeotes)]RLF77572.1 MAG: transporter [Thermococci archaeon]